MIGDNIDDPDRVVNLLAKLHDSYEMLVAALEARVEVLIMETAIEWLLHEKWKMKEKDQGSTSVASPQEVISARHKKRGSKCLKNLLDITLGDGDMLKAVGCGTVNLILEFESQRRNLCKLCDVLCVPELRYNFLSVSNAGEKEISFNDQ